MSNFKNDFEDPGSEIACEYDCVNCEEDCDERESLYNPDYEAERAEMLMEAREAALEEKYKNYEPY